VHFCSNGPYSSGVYSTKMISDIVPHEPLLVIEQPTDTAKRCDVTTSVGLGGGVRKKICMKRWGCIDTFHVIEISPIQLYIAADLNLPHYQVGKQELKEYKKKLYAHVKKHPLSKLLVYSKKTKVIQNKFLTVVNDMSLSQNLIALMNHLVPEQMARIVHLHKQGNEGDVSRGNLFFDRGLCSGKNQKRSVEFMGIAIPQLHSIKPDLSSKDRAFCDMGEKLLMSAAKEWLPHSCQGSKKYLYNVPNVNAEILRMFGLTFHATRYALTNDKNVLNIHVDSQNPTDICDLEHSHMNKPVVCFSTSKDDERYVIIGYGRASLVNASIKILKYGRCLNDILQFYKELPLNRKDITPQLVHDLTKAGEVSNGIHRFPIHVNKLVTYSPFISRIITVQRVNKLDTYQTAAFLYATIWSETPDVFMQVTAKFTKECSVSSTDFRHIAYQLYLDFWKVKRNMKETPGQRYAPTVNREASQDKIVSSVELIISMHHALSSVEENNWEESYLFSKAIAIFSKSPKGIHHAGELLSQHILVIGAVLAKLHISIGLYILPFDGRGSCTLLPSLSKNTRFSLSSIIRSD